MKNQKITRARKQMPAIFILTLCLSISWLSERTFAQTGSTTLLKQQAIELMQNGSIVEAIPMLEKVVSAAPDDAEANFYLGFGYVARTRIHTSDADKINDLGRAVRHLQKAKKLGFKSPLLDEMLAVLEGGGGQTDGRFSSNKQADIEMQAGEAAFVQGKLDDAIVRYKKAFELDPKLYEAPLFVGDMYFKKDDYALAEMWYQKAISVNPNRETAYRYSASPLMKQRKFDQARDRYVEAYITEPYNRMALTGLNQWSQATNTRIGHPNIEVPSDVTRKGDGNVSITLGIGSGDETDGSFAWMSYGLSRALWQSDKDGKLSEAFRKAYPQENEYRHSLAEEFDALRMVVTTIRERSKDKKSKIKKLNPSVQKLVELYEKDLLEAYILMARANRGIAQDHPEYLKNNRDKLRRYVVEYVLTDGGK